MSWLVEEKDAARVRVLAFYQEHEVEAQEPLQSSASSFELDLFWPAIVRNPDSEVIPVGLEPKAVVTLLPPNLELLGQTG